MPAIDRIVIRQRHVEDFICHLLTHVIDVDHEAFMHHILDSKPAPVGDAERVAVAEARYGIPESIILFPAGIDIFG